MTHGTNSGLANPGDVTSFGPFRLHSSARALEKDGVALELGNRALDVLIVLVERAGTVVNHRELMARAWRGLVVDPGNLRVHVSALRKALGDTEGTPRYIATVAGQGYSFVAPVVHRNSAEIAQPSPAIAPAPVAQTRRALPPPLARMIGRDAIVRSIAADLRLDRFVTIVAPGGMGKTTVAISVAHAMVEEFDGLVCFVDIGAIKDPSLLPATIASTLGLAIQTEDALPPLMAYLLGERMLLVLDNCEHLIDVTAPLAERIFLDAPSVHILTTSREALRVEGERACWLPPLESPVPDSHLKANDVLTFPAVKLLMERAAAADSRFELNDSNAPLVAEICARLDGIALALELVGGRVGTYGVEATLNLLNKHLGLHWQGRRTALPRHQTLHALLDWSYGLLAEQERLVFRRLSIFVGTFTLEAAQAVTAGTDLRDTQVASTVDHLVDKSLLSATTADDGVVRFRVLEMTRAFAINKLLESGEETALARRHAGYVISMLDASFAGRLEPAANDRPARREHLGNVRAALEWCFGEWVSGNVDSDHAALAVELAAAAAPAFLELSLLIECHKWSAAALALIDDRTRGSKRELVLQEARAITSTWTRGNGEDVRTAIVRGLEIAQNLGETSHRLRLLTGMHVYLIRTGDFRGSLATADELNQVARTSDDVSWLSLSDWLRGASEHFLGNQADAKRHFENGFARGGRHNAQQFGVDYRIRALVPFARALWLSGSPDRAAQVAQEAIDEGVRSGEPVNVCFSLLYTSTVFLWTGDLVTARNVIERLLTHANWQALVSIHAEGLALKGALLIRLGETEQGVAMMSSALASLKARRQHILTTLGAAWLADGLASLGRFDEALELIRDTIAHAQGDTEALEAPELLRIQATVLLSMPEPAESEAENCLMQSLAGARRQSALSWELRTAMTLARLRVKQGRAAEARQLLASRYARFSEGFESSDLKAARQLLNELPETTSPPP